MTAPQPDISGQVAALVSRCEDVVCSHPENRRVVIRMALSGVAVDVECGVCRRRGLW